MACVARRNRCASSAKKLASSGDRPANRVAFCTQICTDDDQRCTHFHRPVFWPVGQHLTRHTRHRLSRSRSRLLTAATVAACGSPQPASNPAGNRPAASAIPRGGNLVASVRTEPRSFNRLVGPRQHHRPAVEPHPGQAGSHQQGHPGSRAVAGRKLDALRRRPALHAEAAAGRRLLRRPAVHLRRRRLHVQGGLRREDRQQPGRFAHRPTARGCRSTAIDPAHRGDRLRRAVRRRACGCSTTCRSCRGTSSKRRSTPGSSATPGTSRRRRRKSSASARSCCPPYVPGQRLVFDRNPRYFRKAPDGGALPYLDRLTVEIIPDQNAELLRLEAGQIDMTATEIAAEAYAPLKRAADAGRVTAARSRRRPRREQPLVQPQARRLRRRSARRVAAARRAAPGDLAGGRSPAVRRHGVPGRGRAGLRPDHAGQQEVVFGPACRRRRTIPRRRRQMLASIGLTDRNGDGMLEDAGNRPAQFTLLTQKGRPELERGARGHPRRAEEDRRRRRRRGARGQRAHRSVRQHGQVRRGLLQPDHDRHGSGAQSRFLVQLRQRAPVEHGAEDAGHRLGAADRRADGEADRRRPTTPSASGCSTRCRRCSPSTCRSSISPRRASSSPCRRASPTSRRRSRGRRCCGRRTRWPVTAREPDQRHRLTMLALHRRGG